MTCHDKRISFSPSLGFSVREATLNDVDNLTRLWFESFNRSHSFWEAVTPDSPETVKWFHDLWTLGINAGTGILKTFVVEDLSQRKRPVAFARWNVPQADGEQNIPLPPYPREWDAEITDALWEGMARNRRAVMGERRHWSKSARRRFLFP